MTQSRSYRADLPEGREWDLAPEEIVNRGLYQTVARRTDGLTVLINYTPDEAAAVGTSTPCQPSTHPAFQTAEVCTIRHGIQPFCQRTSCVDYLLNSSLNGPGYAVLVGGGRPAQRRAVAARVARSLQPA